MHACVASAKNSVTCHLAAETLRASGALRLRATGYSMLPAIRSGEILQIRRREIDQVRKGEIAVFECYGRLVIHRVIEIHSDPESGPSLIAQGDSLSHPDPPVTQAELLGVVIGIERNGMIVHPSRCLTPMGRVAAAVLRRWPRSVRLLARAEVSA